MNILDVIYIVLSIIDKVIVIYKYYRSNKSK